MTKFFKFAQNNSGGSFDIDDAAGIGPRVWIEANDEAHAMQRARDIGLYFDGVEKGNDCPCCGDRWSSPWESANMFQIDPKWDFNWHNCVYIHFINGQIERIQKENLGQKVLS